MPHVYFVQVGESGPIKIGTATDVARRIQSIQCAHHEPVKVLGVMEGGLKKERDMHGKFAESRIRGEWFKPTSDIIEFVESNCDPVPARAPSGYSPGRSVIIALRLKPDVHTRWQSYANTCGVSLSEWIRQRCDFVTSSAVPIVTVSKERVCTVATPTVHPRTVDRKRLCRRCQNIGVASCPTCKKENA